MANSSDGQPSCATNDEDVCGVCAGPGVLTWYQDSDGDGLGDPSVSTTNCTEPLGYVSNSSDSQPSCATNNEDACGVCAGSGPSTWFEDSDGDGLGDPSSTVSNCSQPGGYVANSSDTQPSCGTNDEDACGVCAGPGPAVWYRDLDSDGLGDPSVSVKQCSQPVGYVSDNSDTEDACATNDTDVCGVCAGSGPSTWYEDQDSDGLGDPSSNESSCSQPTGSVANNSDSEPTCGTNDTDVCGVCAGSGETTWYRDQDGDGLGDPSITTDNCSQPGGFVANSSDSEPACATNNTDVCGIVRPAKAPITLIPMEMG